MKENDPKQAATVTGQKIHEPEWLPVMASQKKITSPQMAVCDETLKKNA